MVMITVGKLQWYNYNKQNYSGIIMIDKPLWYDYDKQVTVV